MDSLSVRYLQKPVRSSFTRNYIINGNIILAEMIARHTEYQSCDHQVGDTIYHFWWFPYKVHADLFIENRHGWWYGPYVFVCENSLAKAIGWVLHYMDRIPLRDEPATLTTLPVQGS